MRIFFSIALAVTAALAAARPSGAQTAGADTLRLGPGDGIRLEIVMEGADEPSGPGSVHLVDDQGNVLLPVVGLMAVAGRPFAEVREEVARAFSAEFTVGAVRLVPLLRIAVLGEVRTPGLVSADPTMSLPELLAAAGGLTESADRDQIRLVRPGMEDLVFSEIQAASSPLHPRSGDRVVVGRRSWASENLPFLLSAGASVMAALVTALLVR